MQYALRRVALAVTLTTALGAGMTACQDDTGSTGGHANAAKYPCGQNVPAVDQAANTPADVVDQPAKAAQDAHNLADQLRKVADQASDSQVKSALTNFASVYDSYGDTVGKGTGSDGKGIEDAAKQISAAGQRLDKACNS